MEAICSELKALQVISDRFEIHNFTKTNIKAALKLCYYVIYIFFVTGLAFYDWESQELIRRIEIQPKNVYWSSENGAELVCISTEVSFIKVSTKNRYAAGLMLLCGFSFK